MSSSPALNPDILLEVASFVSWEDCSALFSACRFLYLESPKIVLQHHTVCFSTELDLSTFLAFLHATFDDKRLTYVCSLHIGVLPHSSRCDKLLRLLALDLARMSSLSSLYLTDSENILRDVPHLSSNIATLTSLQRLSIPTANSSSAQLLRTLQSSLAYANIGFIPDSSGVEDVVIYSEALGQPGDWSQYHPAVLLGHFRGTLRRLECELWCTHPTMTPDPALVYPEMRHLVMRCAESLPCTIAFVRAYPNLRCLSLSSWEGEDGWLPDGHTEQREINLRAQAAPGQSWGVLHEYSGSLSDLYVLGLVCCIERARLYNPVPGHIHLLDPVLSYARPRRLVFGHTLEGADTLLDVSAAIRGSGGSRLEDLTLPIELQSKDKAADVNGLMHALLSSLEHAPLGAIQLCIDTWHVDARPQRERVTVARVRDVPPPPLLPRSEDYPLNAAERSVDEFDVSEYVHRFAQRVRTLRRATVRVIGPRGRWREVTLLEGGEIRMEEKISDSPWGRQ